MPGPPPTPSEIKKRRGSWRADLNPSEPQPDPEKPRCPAWLSTHAKSAWRELAPQLHTMGVLTKVDRGVLAQYVETWARWRECQHFVARNGVAFPVYKGTGDDRQLVEMRTFPQARLARSLVDVLVRLGDRLGLNPAARSRLHARIPYENEDGDEYTGKGKVLGKGRFFGT